MRRALLLAIVVSSIAVTALIGSSASSGATPGSAVRVTVRDVENPVGTPGEVFLRRSFTINYTGGSVTLAGDPTGVGQFAVDDAIRITVIRPDKTKSTYYHDFSDYPTCGGRPIVWIDPVDLSSRLKPGVNTIKLAFKDTCGGLEGTEETWLTLP
jgi:hypothetical protein